MKPIGRFLFIFFLITLSHSSYAQEITENKEEGDALYEKAIQFYEEASYHDAFHTLSEAIKDKAWFNKKSKESKAQIYYKMAFSLYQEENCGEAILWFDQVLHLSKLIKQETYLYRGLCLYEIGKIDVARADLRKSAALKTNAALTQVAHNYLTRIEIENFNKPVFVNEQLLSKDKERYKSGLKNLVGGRLKQAKKDISHTITVDPENYQAHYALGIIFVKIKEFDKATESIEEAIVLAPENIKPFYEKNLGSTYFLIGKEFLNKKDFSKATLNFLEAVDTGAWFNQLTEEMKAQTIYYIANAYFEAKELKRASLYFQKLLPYKSNTREAAYFYLGMVGVQSGQKEQALLHFNKLLQLYPETKFAKQANGYIDNLKKSVLSADITAGIQHDDNVKTAANKKRGDVLWDYANTAQFDLHFKNYRLVAFDLGYSMNNKTYFKKKSRSSDSLRNSVNLKFDFPFYVKYRVIEYQPSVDVALSHSKKFARLVPQNKSIGTTQPFAASFSDFLNPKFTYTLSYTDQRDTPSTITEDIRDAFTNTFNLKNTVYFYFTPLLQTFSFEETFAYNKAAGTYNYKEYETGLSAGGSLFLGVSYNSSVNFTWTDYYKHRQERHDYKSQYTFSLSKKIFGDISSSLNYTFTDVDSNLPDFTYDRNVFALSFSYTLF